MPGPAPDDLEEHGVGADGDAEPREGGEDDGDDGLQLHVAVEEVGEEDDEEELGGRVGPDVSPRGDHLRGGEGGEEAEDDREREGDGERGGRAMVLQQQLLQEAEVG